ncbi:phenylalanyl-trna synthetase subunit beta [Ceraceosorus bombacis]|uniref:Phenylalanine--tRNA ligase beta subunit n=1 Tax=Ceraceosorus bombacis TaxID=401625 RepID=A0A0P1BG09_9BASI|nr:phenylalanyl-trna synthetase subunit beta [Ceraceosorus bombacis]
MPTVTLDKADFFAALGKEYTTKAFDELCFQFGIELDEDTTQQVAGTNERPQLKIDIPANRYDLLCLEGISRALRVFLGQQEQPTLRAIAPANVIQLHVKDSVKAIRPFVSGAVLRGVRFTPQNYASFIDLQDKLHQNLGRRRTLLSMGTHDLDTISGPFTYEGLPPSDISFAPLNRPGQVMDGPLLMKTLEADRHLKPYLSIIADKPRYPVILDSNRTVCSLPPIINSEHSKITLNTRNVFIDMTATDQTKMAFALNILVAMFAEYTEQPFVIEPIAVISPDGSRTLTPDLSSRSTTVRASYINSCTGLTLSSDEIVALLARMGHSARVSNDANVVEVAVPCTRPDIMHECDLMEDVAVAYGFDNLPRRFPKTNTVAQPLPINKLSDLVRRECAYAGWIEVLPLILCSHDENFASLRRSDDGSTAVVLENPKTAEYQVIRTSLLPGILKTLRENRAHALPLRVFEVSDIAVKDAHDRDPQRGAINKRHVSAVYEDKKAAFEVVHGLLDLVMRKLQVSRGRARGNYYIEEADDSTFLPGRGAAIFYIPSKDSRDQDAAAVELPSTAPPASEANPCIPLPQQGKEAAPPSALAKAAQAVSSAVTPTKVKAIRIGSLGVVHPLVLKAFGVDYPCSAIEFELEHFL